MSPRTRSFLAHAWSVTAKLGGVTAIVGALVFIVRLDSAVRTVGAGLHELNATIQTVVSDQRATDTRVAGLHADVVADRRDIDRHEQLLVRLLPLRPIAVATP